MAAGAGASARFQLRAAARRARLRALREQARRDPACFPVIPLASLGLLFSPTGERLTSDNSKLRYLDEGAEAYAFTAPEVPGVIYKFFPLNPSGGHGLVDQLSTDDDDRITAEVHDAVRLKRFEPLLNKLLVIEAVGLPSEVLGIGDDGSVIVKQSEARDGQRERAARFFDVPREIAAMSDTARLESAVAVLDGEAFLVTDLHQFNEEEGVMLDAVVTRLPEIITRHGPCRKFLSAILPAV